MTDKMADEIVAGHERAVIVNWLDTLMPGQFLDMEPAEICSTLAAAIEAGVHHLGRTTPHRSADAKVPAPAWTEFNYAQPVEIVRKRESAPKFPGFVIGWYQRLDGARGYVLQHDPDRIVHVNPVGSVVARVEAQASPLQAERDALAAACARGIDHEKVHKEARERAMNDMTGSGYDHHAAIVAAEYGILRYLKANAAGEVGV